MIEMILVMALLSAIFALASPSLSRFFKGRTILEEARRFLEVTRFAQAQAASLSVPLEVWHDPTERQYGISPLAGYQLDIKEALLLTYDETIHFNAIQNDARSVKGTVILFLPDGTLDEESLYAVSVQQDEDDAIYYIVQNEYGTGFELCDQEEYYNVQFRQSQLEKNFKK